MNYYRFLKRMFLPLLFFFFVLRHYLEVRNAPNPYDILLCKIILIIASVALVFTLIEEYSYLKKNEHNIEMFSPTQLFIFILVVLYVLSLYFFGFVISTIVFLIISFYYFKFTNWKICILTPLCFTFGLYMIFVELLNLKLPSGMIWEILKF